MDAFRCMSTFRLCKPESIIICQPNDTIVFFFIAPTFEVPSSVLFHCLQVNKSYSTITELTTSKT